MSLTEKETKILFMTQRAILVDPTNASVSEALTLLSKSENAAIADKARQLQARIKTNG